MTKSAEIKKPETFRAWFNKNLKDYKSDIASHGCSGGFPYITYYSDTVALHDKFEAEIWDMLGDDAGDMGMNVPELIASFNGSKDVLTMVAFKNLLVWYACEKLAHEGEE